MEKSAKIAPGKIVELSEHSSFISDQSQPKNNKSGISQNKTNPYKGGKTEKPSMIIG